MDIADLRFRGEAITKKGKVYRFDAIECMLGWSAHNRDHIHSRWVGDFAHPGAWLAFGNAFILQSSKLRSPMGAGLSAYGNPQALESSRKIHGGHQLSAKDLTDYIQAWQRDPGAAMRPRNQAAEDSVGQGTGHGRKGQVHSAKEHP